MAKCARTVLRIIGVFLFGRVVFYFLTLTLFRTLFGGSAVPFAHTIQIRLSSQSDMRTSTIADDNTSGV
jgi:hypothetical protein